MVGDEVIAVVRPERCLPGAGPITVHGAVSNVSFVGPSIHVTFTADGSGIGLHAAVPGHALDADRATAFGFEPDDVWLVRGS